MAELNQTMNPGLQTLPQINTPQLFNGQLVKLKSIINNTGNQQEQLFVSATFTFGDVYDTSSKKKKKQQRTYCKMQLNLNGIIQVNKQYT